MQSRVLKIRFTLLFSFFFFHFSFSQTNLVPNPSFEIQDTCPNSVSYPGNQQILHAIPWFTPTVASPDLFDSCASLASFVNVPYTEMGFSYTHTGHGMAGIILMDGDGFAASSTIYREYIMVRLQSPLLNGQKYYLTYYVKLADSSTFASNKIGVLFCDTIYKNSDDTINRIPQICTQSFITNKTNWTKLNGSYIANGTEKFMCIGNFKHPFTNDTLFLGGSRQYTGTNIPYYYIDDICLSSDSVYCDGLYDSIEQIDKPSLLFYPNPVANVLTIENCDFDSKFRFFNAYGIEIHVDRFANHFDFSKISEGPYIMLYITKENRLYNYKLIKTNR